MADSIGDTLARNPIDNRFPVPKPSEITKSIIDKETFLLREKLNDPTIDTRFIAKCIQTLSEKEIADLVEYVLRKANNPGRAFVKLASNVMNYKAVE